MALAVVARTMTELTLNNVLVTSAPRCVRSFQCGVVFLSLVNTLLAGPLEQVTVFQQGESGYHTFRIPAIVQAADNSLLAFAEGRKNGSGDSGNIDLVLKRSQDGGKTWGALQLIQDEWSSPSASVTYGNPAPVVDLLSTTNPVRIWLPFTRNNDRVFISYSDDHGATWSDRVEITSSVKLSTWSWYALGPVHGIQLERGAQAGRLVIPANHNLNNQPLSPAGRESHVIYSDDGGATWHIGGILKNTSSGVNPNESTVVELVDGRVHINARNQGGAFNRRLSGYSTDAGASFPSAAQVENQLVDPVVQAALLRYSAVDRGDASNRILFSNPATETSRVRMTIKSSFDETQSWNQGKMVFRGPSGYSDMVRTPTGGGILYENGDTAYYNRISFARFDTDWLDDPALTQIDFRDGTGRDQRGNGLDGALLGNTAVVAGSPNYDGKALRFNGVDTRVRIPHKTHDALDFNATDSFTIEAIFRTTSHGSGGATGSGPLVAKDVGASTPSYWLRVQDGRLRFFVDDGATNASVLSAETVNDGEWRHVAATFDRAVNEIRLYVNHALVGTQVGIPSGSLANNNDLMIGAFNASSPGDRRFVGDIDLVRISMGALAPSAFLAAPYRAGDFNGDGRVDAADYVAWRANDGNDLLAYNEWRANFGKVTNGSSTGAAAVPEPRTWAATLFGLAVTISFRTARSGGTLRCLENSP